MEPVLEKTDTEIKEDLTMKFIEKTNEAMDVNSKIMAELGDENSYKTSNFYITINFTVIAAASFIFVKGRVLNPFSQILSLFLIFSIIAIILEIIYRKKVINENLKIVSERLKEIEKIQKDFMGSVAENFDKALRIYGPIVDNYNTRYNTMLDVVYQKAKTKDKALSWYRRRSFQFMIISICALTLVLIIESGAIERIINLLTFLVTFCA